MGQNVGSHAPLKDGSAVAAADVVCDLSREAFVVHEEEIEFPNVADQELLQTVGQEMPRLRKNYEKDMHGYVDGRYTFLLLP